MSVRCSVNSRVSCVFLLFWTFLNCFPGFVLTAVVTLDSIQIYKTHEWLKAKPTVYFQCKGENRTGLPDVKNTGVEYSFKGEESWQPLTVLSDKKCKRCGLYEKDSIKADDVYEEWELCPSDFTNGKYTRTNEKEFSATFLCQQCHTLTASSSSPGMHIGGKGIHIAIIVLIVLVVSTVMIIGGVAVFKYWQKKKRQQDQARFLKLFEDGDDIEDELGLGHVI
ncbi:hypothetical protein ACOSQ2_030140 [Xanthoceras sorbifolium]|uniref:DUF7953 domain-containing protein n=1 Tax=Xanthoceras sorbifolium TaxID=99658 RepID=A0ABQ8HAD1_9ROSI|nr:hypothetical protein JRO89_XS12G0013500 [Xanthoceras sorbifolium]